MNTASQRVFSLAGLIFPLAIFSSLIANPVSANATSSSLGYWIEDDEEYYGRYHISDGRRIGTDLVLFGAGSFGNGNGKGLSGGGVPPPGPSYPNDPYYWTTGSWGQSYADLWGVKKIGGTASLWNAYRGLGINIAIVDTGVLFKQEDILSNLWVNVAEKNGVAGVDDDGDGYVDDVNGWDFVDSDNNPADLNGHGSHVAGIAAADDNNSKGIIGVAPDAKIIPVRVLNRSGSGTFQWVADGIRYAARVGAQIINLSLGATNVSSSSQALLQSAVDYARSLGSFVVAAAGNSNADVDAFSPADLNGVIAVGATDPFDVRASFSNFGSKLFITAPGVDILSLGSATIHIGTTVSSNYYRASGTSMAAPFVSGAIALLLQQNPGASLEVIEQKLASGAVDLGATGWDAYYGWGRLDIAASLGVTGATTASSSSAVTSSDSATSSAVQSQVIQEILDKQAALESQALQQEGIKEAGASPVQESTYASEDLVNFLT